MNDATDHRAPYDADSTVEAARDAYLAENGFTLAAYDEPRVHVTLFGLKFWLPNTRKRRDAIPMHDLHHVVTGYGTDPVGEAEISAWELRRGLAGVGLYVRFLVTGLAALGLVIAPRRTIRAWRASGRRAPSLFGRRSEYPGLLQMSVAELRAQMNVPAQGLATAPRRLHGAAPAPETT